MLVGGFDPPLRCSFWFGNLRKKQQRGGLQASGRLYRQHRLSPLFGQLHRERIEEKSSLGVVAHQCRQLHQVLRAELVQGRLEGFRGDFMGLARLRF